MLSFNHHSTTVVATSVPFFSESHSRVQSNLRLNYYIVLKTAENFAVTSEIRRQIYKCLAGCASSADAEITAIGGAANQIHLLVSLNSASALADFVRKIKLFAETWAKRKLLVRLVWQEEYDAFTVSPSQIERVAGYIRRQDTYFRRFGIQEDYASSWRRIASAKLF